LKRLHISISTHDYAASVADYSRRLGINPCVEKEGRYALWRSDILNFSISCKEGQPAGMVRHIGFEDDAEQSFREELDLNGITWEYFSKEAQEEEIKDKFPGAIMHG
jgi:catechol 2,3-dioxygenase-like lactoylglutathione lyase family enzyme